MALIAVASGGKAAGASSTALGLSMWLSDRDPLLIELDRSGGDFVHAWNLGSRPSVVTLASRASSGGDPSELLLEHSVEVPGSGIRAVLATSEPVVLERVVRDLTSKYGLLFAERLTVGDFGRLNTSGGSVAPADVLVMLVRPDLADVARCRGRLKELDHDRVVVGVMGNNPYGASEVGEALGVENCVEIAWDPSPVRDAWAGLDLQSRASWRFRRSAWWRSIRQLGELVIDVGDLHRTPTLEVVSSGGN